MTEYVILKKNKDGAWVELLKMQQAASANAAIKQAMDGANEGGEFIAVPYRSMRSVTVSIEKALKFS